MRSSKAMPRRPIEFAPTTTTATKLSLSFFFSLSLTSSASSSFLLLPFHNSNPTQNQKQNRKNTPERLEIKKYNKFLKRHTVHKEIK